MEFTRPKTAWQFLEGCVSGKGQLSLKACCPLCFRQVIPTFYYLKPFQEKAMSVFMDKFGIDAGIEVIASFEKTGSLGKAMIAYCHSLPKYILKRNASKFSFLVLTEDDKYEWGCRKDATFFTKKHLKEIQKISTCAGRIKPPA